ncbi:hypothetical protein [Aliicoccus persicus]|uniref:Tetratricopeptide repeat-containing protein n=1 Tax=Aliicoccus persicus TaxID=930138 RepID=A0A662Z320_9STAP|nr:hypothetical protein [Aliicoccus persicus]SEW00673.1 hypothetical protein SAMN05192557_1182 [Aliicoccus persicus]
MNNSKIIPFQPDGAFHFRQGMKKIEQNKKSEALQSFEKAFDLEPDNLSYMAQYAYLLAERGQLAYAEKIVIDQFIQHQYDAEFYFIFSQMYMIVGDANKSFLFGMKFSDKFPDENYDEELENVFEIDVDESEDVIEEADIFITSHLFQYLFMNARIDDALDVLNAAPIHLQEIKEFRNLKAMGLLFMNRFEEAHIILEQLLEEDKTDMHALSHMTLLYYHTDAREEYDNAMQKLAVVQPLNDDDQFKIGLVLNFLRKHERSYELLFPLYKKGQFISFQLLHALSHSAYELGHIDESRNFWEKMQQFHTVPELYSPWEKGHATNEISSIEQDYFFDDDLYMRLIGIYRMSRVKPFEAIYGHPVWNTLESLGDLEKIYVSWLYKEVHFRRPETMHHGLNILYENGFTSDDDMYTWLIIVSLLYEAKVEIDDIAPYVAASMYQMYENVTKKSLQEAFQVSRYKFEKALRVISKLHEK